MTKFILVQSLPEIQRVAALAQQIWTQHYTPFLAPGQVPFMLEKFQSAVAIAKQIAEGHQYFLVVEDEIVENQIGCYIGYFDFYFTETHVLISKIYILNSHRGKGFGKAALNFISERAKENGLQKLQLTVNKYNAATISAYLNYGFVTVKDVVVDIGGGFFMDDFVMEKTIKAE